MVQHVPVQKVVQKEACFGHGGMKARHEQEILYGLVQRYVASVQLFSLCSEASLQFQSGQSAPLSCILFLDQTGSCATSAIYR